MKAGEIIERTGITYRQLDHWCRQGYLKTTNNPSGVGNDRIFDGTEALVAMTFAHLVGAGFDPDKTAPVAEALVRDLSTQVGPFRISFAESYDERGAA